jgi:drug/metabolite transporter (DMT)-like permease
MAIAIVPFIDKGRMPYLWAYLSLLAVLSKSGTDIINRRLFKLGYSVHQVIFLTYMVSLVLFTMYVSWLLTCCNDVRDQGGFWKYVWPKSWYHLGWVLAFAVAGFIGLLLIRHAQQMAPNVGYVRMISASSMVLVTIASAWLFNDHLNMYTLLGGALVVSGMFVIVKNT